MQDPAIPKEKKIITFDPHNDVIVLTKVLMMGIFISFNIEQGEAVPKFQFAIATFRKNV